MFKIDFNIYKLMLTVLITKKKKILFSASLLYFLNNFLFKKYSLYVYFFQAKKNSSLVPHYLYQC